MSIYRDLANALSHTMLGTPYDDRSTLPERFQIDNLAEMAEDFAMGDTSLDELIQAFSGTGFDIQLWISQMVTQGHFDLGEG